MVLSDQVRPGHGKVRVWLETVQSDDLTYGYIHTGRITNYPEPNGIHCYEAS